MRSPRKFRLFIYSGFIKSELVINLASLSATNRLRAKWLYFPDFYHNYFIRGFY